MSMSLDVDRVRFSTSSITSQAFGVGEGHFLESAGFLASSVIRRYRFGAMTTLAQQLDEYLRTADEETARRLVEIVRDALALAEIAKDARGAGNWPAGYFQQTAGSLAGERFERPDQGQAQTRETW